MNLRALGRTKVWHASSFVAAYASVSTTIPAQSFQTNSQPISSAAQTSGSRLKNECGTGFCFIGNWPRKRVATGLPACKANTRELEKTFHKMASSPVTIYDTTLRDGTQGTGISFSVV